MLSWQVAGKSSSPELWLSRQPRQGVKDEHFTAGLYYCNPHGASSVVPAKDLEASSATAGDVVTAVNRSRGAIGVRLVGAASRPHYNVLASLMLSGTERALQQVIHHHLCSS
jgi:hypothetical protein